MKVAYFDAFSGVSGDMTVAALLDAGADAKKLIHGLEHLGLGAAYRVEKVIRCGITALKFHVSVDGRPADEQHHHHHHGHEHSHDSDHHHGHRHEQTHDHSHRGYSQIVQLIQKARIPAPVKESSIRVFTALGEAEAQVHGIPLEAVHFHEVGAVDSIADIVGACLGLYLLKVDQVYCSPVNVGSGTVQAAHGVMPVPTPATALLLRDKPVYAEGPAMELTTPTGAAIVAALAAGFGPMPSVAIKAVGYGAGTKDFPDRANVLRVTIGEKSESTEARTVVLIEANIDDASPQLLGYAMDQLFAAGALDVTLTPLLMKKNRAGHMLTIVAKPEDREALAGIVFRETTTLGVRMTTAERRTLAREFVEVETAFGGIRMKVSPNGFAPEFDDCQAIARQKGVPLKDVLSAANAAYLKTRS